MSSKEYMAVYRKANRLRLREYDKAYRTSHPEVQKRSNAKYRSKNKEKAYLAKKRWVERNREKSNLTTMKWVKKNYEKVLAKNAKYRAANKEKEIARRKKYNTENAHKLNALTAYHRALKLRATPAWANKFILQEAYDLARRRSKLKTGGIDKWHVDHIVPLQSKLVCGLHTHTNIRVIPASVNHRKSNVHWPDMPGPVIGADRHVA